MRWDPHPPTVWPVMRTRRPQKICSPQSEDASSAVPVVATPLHDNGAVAHRHVRRLPERGTYVGWSALRSGVALFLFGAGPRPSQQPGYAERPASHPVVDVVFVSQPDPSLIYSVCSFLSYEILYSIACVQSIRLATSVLSRGLPKSAARASRRRTPRRPRGARPRREAASINGSDRSSSHRPR